jgi:hypothetical protein
MAILDYLPFRSLDNVSGRRFVARTIDPENVKQLPKTMKIAALALGFQGSTWYYNSRSTFEPSPYDFDRIMQAVDTDSYVRQAMNKYKELFWKEGWQISGENQEAVSYLYQRIDFIEMAMKRPFIDFLEEVSDQLFKFSNAFIVKARGDISEYFPEKLNPINSTQPIVGYYLIPTEQVRILRDKFNRPKAYQQSTDPLTYSPTDKDPVWAADRVIHIAIDKKTGRAFGTPFLSNVLDDVVALRQMEEDIQNLVHRELFPLYKYTIGTPEQPAEPNEIDRAAAEIENLRSEGGLILPHRHNIDIVGAGKEALDAAGYLEHFKERVSVGLGLAPHHLGIGMNGGNRSVTDRLDVALYDKIKKYQKIFSETIRLHMFNELLFEAGYDPILNPVTDGISDRCYFKFNEIDVDTQVKKETHVIQKFVNNLIGISEARLELNLSPDVDETELFAAMQGKVQVDIIDAQSQMKTQDDSDKQASSTGGQRNLPNKRRGAGNAMRPANQSGRKTSPNIRRSDLTWLSVVENVLEKDYNVVYTKEESEKDSTNAADNNI